MSELETLLNSGLSANTRDEWNATPLHWAACRGRIDACTLLLDHGADVQATDDTRGATPLHWAAAEGATDICALLLDRGADVNARDKYGRPPLHNAANENHIETLALLETRGADVNMMDATGWAPRYAHTVSGKQLYPEAIDAMGWCWGGFTFSLIWAIAHRMWVIVILRLVPVLGVVVPFYLGFRGHQLAWQYRSFESFIEYKNTMRVWDRVGFWWFLLNIVAAGAYMLGVISAVETP